MIIRSLPFVGSAVLNLSGTSSGAGLGGLILALFLQKDCPDFQVDIYESTQELTELGAGIGFFPRVWEILRYLGLEEDLLKIAGIRGGHEECSFSTPGSLLI